MINIYCIQQFTVDTLARAAATAALLQLQQQQQLVETAVTKDNGDSVPMSSTTLSLKSLI
jgi:hypothetical protein